MLILLRLSMSPTPSDVPVVRHFPRSDGSSDLVIGGTWRAGGELPALEILPGKVRILAENLVQFDSCLPAWLHFHLKDRPDADIEMLPARLKSLVGMAKARTGVQQEEDDSGFLENIGEWGIESTSSWNRAIEHVGRTAVAVLRTAAGRARVNWIDFRMQLQIAGIDALPIVALLGFLTGLIMAYVGLIQLKQVGATVYVANLVALAMAREMGALMTGIIACGRTSTSFASQLGSMNVSQETDALRALGVDEVEYLAFPRILAVTLMVPLLSVFATFIGVLGGMVVACAGELSVEQYVNQAILAVSWKSFLAGLVKSVAFGFIAAWAGCYRGSVAKRSALGVGEAATSAAVLGITLIVIADAVFAVLFNLFGI